MTDSYLLKCRTVCIQPGGEGGESFRYVIFVASTALNALMMSLRQPGIPELIGFLCNLAGRLRIQSTRIVRYYPIGSAFHMCNSL